MLWWTLRQLKSEDWKEREDAAKKLGQLNEPKVVEPLVDALKDRNAHVRHAIEDALVQIGQPAVAPLLVVLRDRNPDLRRAAESVLVKMGDLAVGALGSNLSDTNLEVREAAAAVLSRIQDPSAINQLLAVVKRGGSDAKQAAATGLVRAGHSAVKPLTAALKETVPGVRETAAAALVRIGSKATESLIASLQDPASREAAIDALDKIDPQWTKGTSAMAAVPALIASLKDPSDRLRKNAARALGQIKDPRIFEPLAAAAFDRDEAVQEAVGNGLGTLGDPRAVQPLVNLLRQGSAKGRRAAAAALVTLGGSAVEPLVEALKDRDSAVREAAATVLVRVGHAIVEPLADALWRIDPEWAKSESIKEGVPQFVAALKEGKSATTQEPGNGTRKSGPARVVKPLVAMLKAKEAIVRKEMLPSLHMGDLADVQAISETLADSDPDVRAAAMKRLLQISSTSGEPLLGALKHNSHMVRRAAAHALAQACDPRGRDVLRSDLLDVSELTVLDAAESLVRIDDITVVQPLLKLLNKFNDSFAQHDGSSGHKKERAILLLYRVIEQHGKDIPVDDLRAVAKLHEPDKRFIASTDARKAADQGGPENAVVSEATLDSKLSEIARRELNRRSTAR
jgi:HEAT repeat protein